MGILLLCPKDALCIMSHASPLFLEWLLRCLELPFLYPQPETLLSLPTNHSWRRCVPRYLLYPGSNRHQSADKALPILWIRLIHDRSEPHQIETGLTILNKSTASRVWSPSRSSHLSSPLPKLFVTSRGSGASLGVLPSPCRYQFS